MYKGFTAIHFESLFTLDCNNKGTRGHLAKLSKPRCQKDVRKYFFLHRVIDRWNALDGEAVSSSSINGHDMKAQKTATKTQMYFQQKRKCRINKTATCNSKSATSSVSVMHRIKTRSKHCKKH